MANFTILNSSLVGGVSAGTSQRAITTTYNTQILVGNSTTSGATISGQLRRGKLYDILVGTNGTAADNFMEWQVCRATMGASSTLALGLSSLSSQLALDPADNTGCVNMLAINSSIETAYTLTSETWYVGVNQRASYRWVAAPGSEIVWPANSSATGNNGILCRARSGGYTGTATVNLLWQEQ